ncbi:helix-turn-helix domain-containing protein [Actinomadura terrae]|uniref:helix-turn-helix domain-containing protein n=1 Tax=Actinomadura terrae TaxID=604353 RepID=UPI001FA78471|nr:helix-turn-helix transcriptional regulator [Actinomadura terrae]
MVNRKKLDPTESVAALFGVKVRSLRDARGLSQAQLADKIGYSNDTVSKVETAAQAPSPALAGKLDEFFGTDEYFQELQPLTVREGVPIFFRQYTELESTASAVRVYEPSVVNGLFQIDDYARAVLRPGQAPGKLDQSISARMGRQEVLEREDPPWIVVYVVESAIRKLVGDAATTKGQLVRLLELMAEPNITVLVMPTDAPVYPGGGFTLFTLENGLDIAYVEGAGGQSRVVEVSSHVEELRRLWDMIGTVALSAAASEALIREVMESL